MDSNLLAQKVSVGIFIDDFEEVKVNRCILCLITLAPLKLTVGKEWTNCCNVKIRTFS
jgi:hypothetical protein